MTQDGYPKLQTMLPPLRFVREDALRRPDHVKCLSGPWQAALVRVDKLEELLCPLADLMY